MMLRSIYVSSATARLVVVLIAATAVIPYLVRPTKLSVWLGLRDAWKGGSIRRMGLHVWLGYAIVIFASVHTAAAMSLGDVTRFDPLGLWFAVVAFASLVIIFSLGRRLTQPIGWKRPEYRTWHFWMAIVLIVSAFGHTLLNSPTVRLLVR
jgi:hypothetical protein